MGTSVEVASHVVSVLGQDLAAGWIAAVKTISFIGRVAVHTDHRIDLVSVQYLEVIHVFFTASVVACVRLVAVITLFLRIQTGTSFTIDHYAVASDLVQLSSSEESSAHVGSNNVVPQCTSVGSPVR